MELYNEHIRGTSCRRAWRCTQIWAMSDMWQDHLRRSWRGCTCCIRCGNSEASCTCCQHCDEALNLCKCHYRLRDIWSIASYCVLCPTKQDSTTVHQVGQPCPLCCCKCKELKQFCNCCQKCGTTPCICCARCGNLSIKCRCWGAKILSHFMRRAVNYHNYQQELR